MVIGSAAIAVSSWARIIILKLESKGLLKENFGALFALSFKKLSMNEKFSYKIHEKILEMQILIKST